MYRFYSNLKGKLMNYIEQILEDMKVELNEKKLYNSLHTIEFFEADKSVRWLLSNIAKHIIASQMDKNIAEDAQEYLDACKLSHYYRPIC